jgi:hypothetical protein
VPTDPRPEHPEHEYRIIASESPPTVDGYARGEPKRLCCEHCEAGMVLTEDKTPGAESLTHEPWCPNCE